MAHKTIKVKKHADVVGEYTAHAVLFPGALLKLDDDNEVRNHNSAGGNVVPIMFALEDELQGNGIDVAYAAGDKVQVWFPGRGDEVLGILADGQSVERGDAVESNGAGYLRAHTADPGDSTTGTVQEAIIGIVLEHMDASSDSSGQDMGAGLGVNKRVKVLIK